MTHLKRYSTPRSWGVNVKGIPFITRPNPGPHPQKECMPLNIFVKRLKYASTTREVKKLLNAGKILVNGNIIKDQKFPVGIMDVISIPDAKENFRVLIDNKGKFLLTKTKDADSLLCKVKNKTVMKGKKLQVNLTNGFNILVAKDDYKVGDTLIISPKTKEIKKHIKLEKGAHIYLIGGRHIGTKGIVEEIILRKDLQAPKIIFKTDKHKYETLRRYAFAIEPNLVNIEENDKSNETN